MAVVEKGSYVGLYTFTVDPGKDSNTQKMVAVVAHSIPKNSSASGQLLQKPPPSSPGDVIVLNEWYQYTPVLRFSTNYNISVQYYYPLGTKIRIQTKWRDPSFSDIWFDGGYVEMTVDGDMMTSSWRNGGPQITEVQFEFKYQHSYVIGRDSYIEVVNAVSIFREPRGLDEVQYSWDGQPVSGVAYIDLLQNDTLDILVTGGSTYVFSVGINLPNVSISLGVTKAPDPYVILKIKADTWYPGAVAKIVSLGDGSFLDTRAFWYSSS